MLILYFNFVISHELFCFKFISPKIKEKFNTKKQKHISMSNPYTKLLCVFLLELIN